MSEVQKPSGLETLVVRILDAASLQDIDRDEIAFIVFHEAFGDDYEKAADSIGLDRGIMDYLARADDWRKALRHLLSDRRVIVALANDLYPEFSQYEYCARNSSVKIAFTKLLDTIQLPTIRRPKKFRGRTQLDSFLTDTRQELSELDESNFDRFKDLADRGWGELETITKILVGFYRQLFDNSSEIAKKFDSALNAAGLNQRFDKIRGIQKRLGSHLPNNSLEEEIIYCKWRLGRSTPFGALLAGDVEVNLSDVPSRWSNNWQDKLAKYDNSHTISNGYVSILRLNYYKTNVDFYRHFYAHANRQEWINSGRKMVRRSFEAAAEIIQRILDLNLCPDMIIPIAVGVDGFQRRVAFFVHERDLEPDGAYARNDIKVMFLGGDQAIELHSFYFCPYPAKSGMFEPFLVPADEVIEGD